MLRTDSIPALPVLRHKLCWWTKFKAYRPDGVNQCSSTEVSGGMLTSIRWRSVWWFESNLIYLGLNLIWLWTGHKWFQLWSSQLIIFTVYLILRGVENITEDINNTKGPGEVTNYRTTPDKCKWTQTGNKYGVPRFNHRENLWEQGLQQLQGMVFNKSHMCQQQKMLSP